MENPWHTKWICCTADKTTRMQRTVCSAAHGWLRSRRIDSEFVRSRINNSRINNSLITRRFSLIGLCQHIYVHNCFVYSCQRPAYEAETSCNEDVIDSATYIHAQDQFAFINKTAMSLYDTTEWNHVFLLLLFASAWHCVSFVWECLFLFESREYSQHYYVYTWQPSLSWSWRLECLFNRVA